MSEIKNEKKIKHFIITYFNVKHLDVRDKKGECTLTDKWLEGRFGLFEKYCLPSVVNQTEKNFIWLCLFDKDTPNTYKNRIEDYSKSFTQLKVLYLSDEEGKGLSSEDEKVRCGFLKDKMKSMIEPDDVHVITTNLDNDDALDSHFVQRIQEESLCWNENVLIRFQYGLQYFESFNGILAMKYPHNHFLSLIERVEPEFHTIEYYNHARAHKIFKHVDIYEKPYWVEVVHSHNVNNELRISSRIGYKFVFKSINLDVYGIRKSISWKKNIINIPRFVYLFICVSVLRIGGKIKRMKK